MRKIKVRKEHVCEGCGKKIGKGEICYIDDGSLPKFFVGAQYWCEKCGE